MRSTRMTAALLAAAALGTAGFGAVQVAPHQGTSASAQSGADKPAQSNKQAPGDTKIARLNAGFYRTPHSKSGKRYSASVRQHQRNAAKARNRRKAR